ncbi:phosphatidylinositol transfer protein [Sorangium sp. So ce726]|uniref:LNS2 domain-containing protein n=1 Tax=Sorangium sp. So ce726 TaxID=3133319 RepID=UPI003F635845
MDVLRPSPLAPLVLAAVSFVACAGAPRQADPPAPSRPRAGACPARPACDAPPPAALPRGFRHTRSRLVAAGWPRHRGRDLFARADGPQWAIAKFAYGPQDDDLEDEDVEAYLLRGCSGAWERLGTFRTSDDDHPHPTTEGIPDTGGRVYIDLAAGRHLEVGRHRVHLAVAGDATSADLFIEVLPSGAQVAVTDVDGTLTSSEVAVVSELVGGAPPAAHPGAADAMRALAESGIYLFYVTARPEWLVGSTRVWLREQGFPPGILHTTIGVTGAFGGAAAEYKTIELGWLKARTGIVPAFGFGNMPSDVATYTAAGIPASRCYYYKLGGDLRGGVPHDDYRGLAPALFSPHAACAP